MPKILNLRSKMDKISESGIMHYQTLLRDDVVRDVEINLKVWIEEEHVIAMVKEADRLGVQLRLADLKHDWLDLDDKVALTKCFQSGEFDITRGRPHPGCRWRLISECPYITTTTIKE